MAVNPNRRLTADERAKAHLLLDDIRKQLDVLSGGDADLRFAYNRFVYIRLNYDERGNPAERGQLKEQKWKEQNGLCPECGKPLPLPYAVLDRLSAMPGYTTANTRLIHPECDYSAQKAKSYT
jgi:hypothetical protein